MQTYQQYFVTMDDITNVIMRKYRLAVSAIRGVTILSTPTFNGYLNAIEHNTHFDSLTDFLRNPEY